MAINAAHWTITRTNGNIRYTGPDHDVGGESYATVIELRRWLGQLADDQAQADSSDELAIYDEDPADRLGTDNIIRLKGLYNIDDGAAEHLYDGSILQGSGDTETIYDGFVNFGNANAIQIIQNGAVLADDWWNLNTGGVNPDTARGISHRFMLKVKSDGVDIDGRRVVGSTRQLDDTNGYTFAEFKVNGTSRGNNTLALSEALDLNNESTATTISGWTGITNTEGYRSIDINNDGTDEGYYSEWNTNQPTRSINDFYERMKWLTRDGTASTLYGINGELFRGITHSIAYDTETASGLAELKLAVWGTDVAYDTELASGLTVGENYIFSGGARGQLLALDDDGASGTAIFGLSDTTAIADDETFVRADGTATDGASVNDAALTGEGDVWGAGLVLAKDGTNSTVHIQLLKGSAPTDGVVMTEATLAGVYDTATDGTAAVNVTVTERNISTPFIGSSTGSAIVGAYGVGIEYADLTASDKLTPLVGTVKSPPNNQTFTVSGLANGEDRVLVAPWDGVSTDNEGFPAIEVDQLTLNGALTGASTTAIVVNGAIPVDTPASGVIRVELDDGQYFYQAYSSWDTSTFTVASTDYSGTGNNGAADANNVYIAYVDETASGSTAEFTAQYVSDRNLVVIVRDGGGSPIKQYISSATFNSGGGGSVVTRTSDL